MVSDMTGIIKRYLRRRELVLEGIIAKKDAEIAKLRAALREATRPEPVQENRGPKSLRLPASHLKIPGNS
jgi:hypothetical protein